MWYQQDSHGRWYAAMAGECFAGHLLLVGEESPRPPSEMFTGVASNGDTVTLGADSPWELTELLSAWAWAPAEKERLAAQAEEAESERERSDNDHY